MGLWHGLSADIFTLLFALSWWFRMASPASPSGVALIFSFIGFLVVPMVGWLGGELVFKHLIGVEGTRNVEPIEQAKESLLAKANAP